MVVSCNSQYVTYFFLLRAKESKLKPFHPRSHKRFSVQHIFYFIFFYSSFSFSREGSRHTARYSTQRPLLYEDDFCAASEAFYSGRVAPRHKGAQIAPMGLDPYPLDSKFQERVRALSGFSTSPAWIYGRGRLVQTGQWLGLSRPLARRSPRLLSTLPTMKVVAA
jgi:hypothetical protein